MKPTLGQRIDVITRNSLPVLFTILLIVINVLPLHIPGFARIVPVLPLIAVYHWSVYRPELMPPLAVFVIGVLYDILSGTPLGVNALVFLAVSGVVRFQQRFFVGRSFFVVWLGFAIVALGSGILSWVLVSVLSETLVEPKALAFQFILNFGFFPVLAWLFLRWQHLYLQSE